MTNIKFNINLFVPIDIVGNEVAFDFVVCIFFN